MVVRRCSAGVYAVEYALSVTDIAYWDPALAEGGRLGLALGDGRWSVPTKVEHREGMLMFDASEWREVSMRPNLLERVVNAGQAFVTTGACGRPTDASIRRLASTWGPVLYLPDDVGHTDCVACDRAREGAVSESWLSSEQLEHYAEPLDLWRRLIGDLRGCLRIAQRFHADAWIKEEDWALFGNVVVGPLGPAGSPAGELVTALVPTTPAALLAEPPGGISFAEVEGLTAEVTGDARRVVSSLVEMMMSSSVVRLSWQPNAPRVEMRPTGVLSALGLATANWIVRGDRTALCAGCGRLYRARRKPRAGEQTWCDRERCKKAAQRARQARTRANRRDGRA